jgi:hypothetical protein
MVVLEKRLRTSMLKEFRRRLSLLTCLATAIVAGLFVTAPTSLKAAPPPRQLAVYVQWSQAGNDTVTVPVGQELVVKLPIRGYHDDSWHVTKISPNLKLVGGPDELRPIHWSPWKFSFQVFYFKRIAPGPAALVMEPNYYLKPMVLKVLD